jgi:beta-galactosidase
MITYRGVAYYPEFWPQERWDEDIRLMSHARINLVRIGEFAWSAIEPVEGRFDFDWLDGIVDRLAAVGIHVLMCTPTAAPPAWLTARYPQTLLVRRDGRRAAHGARRHYCPTSSTYREHVRQIVTHMSRELGGRSNVIAWQIDNELGPEMSFCHCDHCSDRFRAWLRDRYGSLDSLNAAWQTRFWSVTFTDWEQIHLQMERGFPSIELDIKRFHSDSFIDFARTQVDAIRVNHPGARITTNMVGPPLLPYTNYFQLAGLFDFVGDDLYFDVGTMDANAMACDMFRCAAPGKHFWLTETGIGALAEAKVPESRQIRAWAFSACARGAEAYTFFRWRTCPAGQEQDLQGVLETSGLPGRRYACVKSLFAELASLEPALADLPLPRADVAIVMSYDALWAYESTRVGRMVRYAAHVQSLYRQCYDLNVQVDVVPPDRDLHGYRLVILPSLCIVDDGLARRLQEFVQGGGALFATPQLATRDQNNNYHTSTSPRGLAAVFGCEVLSHTYMESTSGPDESLWFPEPRVVLERVSIQSHDYGEGHAERYMEELSLKGGKAEATFQQNLYAECPVVVHNKLGSGSAWYVGAYLDDAFQGAVLERGMNAAGVPTEHGPKWIERVRRGDVTFLINHGLVAASVAVDSGEVLVGTATNAMTRLEPYSVVIIRKSNGARVGGP